MGQDKGKEKAKLDVASRSSLAHNPFAKLASLAPELPVAPSSVGVTVAPTRPDAKVGCRVVISKETKHRGGKQVLLLRGFESQPSLDKQALMTLCAELKRELACGGTTEAHGDGFQLVLNFGDPGRVRDFLVARGFRVAGITR